MAAPIDEEEVVVSLRLQPVVARRDGWRGRSSGLVAAGLVGFVVVAIALSAVTNDRRPASTAAAIVPEPSAATPAPSRRPTPTPRPRLPPLPAVQVIGGEIPTERRLVYANGLQILDLATGELATPARPWEDLVLTLGDGDVVCACMVRGIAAGAGAASSVVLRFERSDASGTDTVEHDVMTFDGIVEVPEMSPGFTMVAAMSRDEQSLFVLTAVRRPPVWTVELHQVDAASGELVGTTALGELPTDLADQEPVPSDESPTPRPEGVPPDGVYLWVNWLTMSPDGAFASASLSYSEARGDTWTNGIREWMIPFENGRTGDPVPYEANSRLGTDSWCLGPPEFITNDVLVQVCTSPDGPGQDGYIVRRVNTAGTSLGALAVPETDPEERYQPAVAVSRALGAVLTWDPIRHSLARISIDDGAVMVRDVARSMLPDVNPPNGRGYFGADPGLVVSPDGGFVYALGFGLGPSDGGTSTGIWVFDGESLNLIDHWLPKATLTSIALSADGRFIYAAGANGFDVEGNQSPWPASVSVYDAETGEIQIIYGAVSRDAWVNFRPVP